MEPEEYLEQHTEPVRIEVDENGLILPAPECERCYKPLDIGEHGHLICPLEPRRSHGVIQDTIIGGLVMQHVDVGRRVESRSELRAVLAAKGWRLADNKSEADHAKFLRERAEYAGDTQKERDRERLGR